MVKVIAEGEEVIVAKKKINMSMHFGREHNLGCCEMEPTKDAGGIKVKDLVYIINLTNQEEKNQEIFDQCILWRKS